MPDAESPVLSHFLLTLVSFSIPVTSTGLVCDPKRVAAAFFGPMVLSPVPQSRKVRNEENIKKLPNAKLKFINSS